MPWWGWVLASWPIASISAILLLIAFAREREKELRAVTVAWHERHTVHVLVETRRARASARRLAS